MGKKTKAHWDKFCADWNAKYPVGTEVVLKRDAGNDHNEDPQCRLHQ